MCKLKDDGLRHAWKRCERQDFTLNEAIFSKKKNLLR